MNTTRNYDMQNKKYYRTEQWETVDENGEIVHHRSDTPETYSGPAYVRVFKKQFRITTKTLNKTAYDALFFIIDKMDAKDNVAKINYSDLEKYLEVSNMSVCKIMTTLQKADIIRMRRRGQWMVNPNLVAECYEWTRKSLVADYLELQSYETKKGADKNATEYTDGQNAYELSDESSDVYNVPHQP